MERTHAYKASDGSLWNNSREWVEHEFYLLLCECTLNADKQMAAEMVDRFREFYTVHNDFASDAQYGEGKRLGVVLDRRTIPKAKEPYVDLELVEVMNQDEVPPTTPLSKGQSDDVAF